MYAVTGHTFGAANAYTALALFNLLRLPLAFLPMMVTMLINALVALNRIGDFLMKPESGMAALRQAAEGTPPGHVKVCVTPAYCSVEQGTACFPFSFVSSALSAQSTSNIRCLR